jgi:hypothetical protein
MRALRAIAAILGTAAGLDAEQARRLNMVRIEVGAVNALRPKHQIREREFIESLGFLTVPVVPQQPDVLVGLHLGHIVHMKSPTFHR